MNNIAKVGTDRLGDNYTLTENIEEADAVMVRSAKLHDTQFPKKLIAIARAGAGVNNIPLDRCAEEGIVVFNTPGANANAVKEMVILGMLLACRDIYGGITWVKDNCDDPDISKKAEKAKKQFSGIETILCSVSCFLRINSAD
jgi:D-3-phosphoglycerate dehydrogenase